MERKSVAPEERQRLLEEGRYPSTRRLCDHVRTLESDSCATVSAGGIPTLPTT
jgi:hypothetical protein